jgi:hypothetical protein
MASEDDEEYLPSDMDEEAFLQQAYATDEEGYLQGATTGVCVRAHRGGSSQLCAQEPPPRPPAPPAQPRALLQAPHRFLNLLRRVPPLPPACLPAAEDDDDEEAPEFFGVGADPMTLLAGMQQQERLGRDAFEVLASRKRRSRRERKAAEAEVRACCRQQQHATMARGRALSQALADSKLLSKRAAAVAGDKLCHAAALQEGEPGGSEGGGGGDDEGGDQPGPSGQAGSGSDAGVFGLGVQDIWNDSLAEQMGMQPPKNRKKAKARERARWVDACMGACLGLPASCRRLPACRCCLPAARCARWFCGEFIQTCASREPY